MGSQPLLVSQVPCYHGDDTTRTDLVEIYNKYVQSHVEPRLLFCATTTTSMRSFVIPQRVGDVIMYLVLDCHIRICFGGFQS